MCLLLILWGMSFCIFFSWPSGDRRASGNEELPKRELLSPGKAQRFGRSGLGLPGTLAAGSCCVLRGLSFFFFGGFLFSLLFVVKLLVLSGKKPPPLHEALLIFSRGTP